MELLNHTKMQAGYTMGTQPDGRELLVVVVKGTFAIPQDSGKAELAPQQVELFEKDLFSGEAGLSAPLYEMDYAPRKPRCDVLLNGSAHAPGGQPAQRVPVGIYVGALRKSFSVVGNRVWRVGFLSISATDPEPFTAMPISYDNAFGGADRVHEDPAKHRWFLPNHVGVGYHHFCDAKFLNGNPLPNTEEIGDPIVKPNGNYRPMAFGPLARAWETRVQHAGTYDQNWIDNVSPFLPADFKDEYYQAAPADQQMPFPHGGEEVVLHNLTPAGQAAFRLPTVSVPVEFFYLNGERKKTQAVLDTIVIEPELGRFMLSWRVCMPLKRNIFDVRQVAAGEPLPITRPSVGTPPQRHFRSPVEFAAWNKQSSSVPRK